MSNTDQWTAQEHETGILHWVSKEKRDRYAGLISSKKGRRKLLARLYHNHDWAEKVLEEIPPHLQNPASIASELKKRGGGDLCYCFSTSSEFDGQVVTVSEALGSLLGSGDSAVLSLVPGKLGYYESEEPGHKYILHR